jgi:hypothetical protein
VPEAVDVALRRAGAGSATASCHATRSLRGKRSRDGREV